MCEGKLMIGPLYGIFCLDDDEPSGNIQRLYVNFPFENLWTLLCRRW